MHRGRRTRRTRTLLGCPHSQGNLGDLSAWPSPAECAPRLLSLQLYEAAKEEQHGKPSESARLLSTTQQAVSLQTFKGVTGPRSCRWVQSAVDRRARNLRHAPACGGLGWLIIDRVPCQPATESRPQVRGANRDSLTTSTTLRYMCSLLMTPR